MYVFEHNVCDTWLDIIWWLEDDGIVLGHGEGVLDCVSVGWDSCDHNSFLGVGADHFVDDEVKGAGLFVEVGAKTDNGTVWQFPGMRHTRDAHTIILPFDLSFVFEGLSVNLKLNRSIGGSNKGLVVSQELK